LELNRFRICPCMNDTTSLSLSVLVCSVSLRIKVMYLKQQAQCKYMQEFNTCQGPLFCFPRTQTNTDWYPISLPVSPKLAPQGCLLPASKQHWAHLLWWKDFSFGCSSTNSTTRRRMSATELAVEATMDSAGTPSDVWVSLSMETSQCQKHFVPTHNTWAPELCNQMPPTQCHTDTPTVGSFQGNCIKQPMYTWYSWIQLPLLFAE
jgi:hypothetical protein